MKDEQKSRALMVCRILIDVYEEARESGYDMLPRLDLVEAVAVAKTLVARGGSRAITLRNIKKGWPFE